MSTMMLRNSERQAFMRCRWYWREAHVTRVQAREAPNALRFGDLVHQALAAYYKPGTRRGPHPAKTFLKLYDDQAAELHGRGFDVFADEKWVDARELGPAMLEGYVTRYAAEDREYKVLASEMTFQVPVKHPTIPRFRVIVVGTLDGVWQHRKSGRILFKEFKTAASLNPDGLAMDDQASLYYTYAPRVLRRQGILGPDDDIREIMYTFLRKAAPNNDRPRNAAGLYLNKDGSVSKQQPSPFFMRVPVYRDSAERAQLHERVMAQAAEIHAARRGEMAVYKNPGPLYMPNCRGCFAQTWCELHEVGGDWEPVRDQLTVSYDPYDAHHLPERK